ncbi:hypothetical protein Zmor_025686 [Zophobas morio]|uniref:Uncharacterized protein n=1 Tax=Zophobas morio TaxID=2755281 RepID=A0AA38HTY1_9CUCU|nr:hypothetical protein Zmor_025686 [Zophobas morio]
MRNRDEEEEEEEEEGGVENLNAINERIRKIEREDDGRNVYFSKELKKPRKCNVRSGIRHSKGAEEENLDVIKRKLRTMERENNIRNEYFSRSSKRWKT